MRVNKKLARNFGIGLGCVLVLAVGFYFFAIRSLDRAFARANFSPLLTRTKAAIADVLVMRQSALAAGISDTHQPAAIQLNAKLFDTWFLSAQIANSTLKTTAAGSWVRSTEEAAYLPAGQRRDPWNHSLCILRRGEMVAVISGGPNAPSSPECRDIAVSENELAKLPHGRLIETSAGDLLLVVDGKASASATPTGFSEPNAID